MKRLTASVALVVALALSPADGFGQAPSPGGDGDVAALIGEIETLIRRAEATRAADPRFVADLRAALRRYRTPWSVVRLSDDFGDGDYTRNPTWTVRSGEFTIDPRYGLRGRLAPRPAVAAGSGEAGGSSYKDLAGSLLKQILKRGDGGSAGSTGSQPNRNPIWGPPTDPDWAGDGTTGETAEPASAAPPAATPPAARRSEISTAFRLSNAFSIRLELVSLTDSGQAIVGPYQGGDRAAGYRLAYGPGRPSLRLLAVSPRGVRVIAAHDQPLAVADGAPHRLQWNRWPDGLMTVLFDGREVMRVTDRGFSDGFDGLTFVNDGGDVALRSVLVRATR